VNAEGAVLEMDADPEAAWQRYEQLRQQPGLVPSQVDRELAQNYFTDSVRDPARVALLAERLSSPESLEAGELNRIQLGFARAELLDRLGRRDESRALAQRMRVELAAAKPASRGRGSAAVLAVQLDAFLGNTAAARAGAAQLISNPPSDYMWPVETGRGLMTACARMGDADAAFDLAERAMDRFSPSHFAPVLTGTAFDSLRELPRYKALLARYEAWRAAQAR
jgi:hypothetical protein